MDKHMSDLPASGANPAALDPENAQIADRLRALARAPAPWSAARAGRIWARVEAPTRRRDRWGMAGALAAAGVLLLALAWTALRPPPVSAHVILTQALAAAVAERELMHTTVESYLSPLVVADPAEAGTRRIETWGDPPRPPFRVEEYDAEGRLRWGLALDITGGAALFDGQRLRTARLTPAQMQRFVLPVSADPSLQTVLQEALANPAVENRGRHGGVWKLRARSESYYPGYGGETETILLIDGTTWQFRELSEWRLDGRRELLRRQRLVATEPLPGGATETTGASDPNGRSFLRLAVPPATGEERVAPEALGIPLLITLDQLARDPYLTARVLPQTPGGPALRMITPTGWRRDTAGSTTGYRLEYRWPDGRLLALSEQPAPPGGNELPPEFKVNPIPMPGAVAGWREEGDALSPLLTALVLYDDGTVVIVLAERLPPDELVALVQSLVPVRDADSGQ